jgi:phospholipase C
VASDVYDHTSQLRLVERRFGVPVPNLSDWRRQTVTDLGTAFNFGGTPQYDRPRLPNPDLAALKALLEGNIDILLGFFGRAHTYPVPPNEMPTQEPTPARGRPRG